MQISPIPTLSEEINDIRLRTADIVANRIVPNESIIYAGGEKSKKLRKEINEEVKKQGLWAPHLPTEYGGMDNGFLELAYMNEILAWSPLGNRLFGVIAPNSGNQKILVKYGTDEQKKKWLIPLINQEMESGFSMTEPDSAGSDPRSLKTTAVREGDEWVINGHKIMTSNGNRADFLVVMCRTEEDGDEGGVNSKMTQIIVPTDSPGLTKVRSVPIWGHTRGDHMEIKYENVRVPVENALDFPNDLPDEVLALSRHVRVPEDEEFEGADRTSSVILHGVVERCVRPKVPLLVPNLALVRLDSLLQELLHLNLLLDKALACDEELVRGVRVCEAAHIDGPELSACHHVMM